MNEMNHSMPQDPYSANPPEAEPMEAEPMGGDESTTESGMPEMWRPELQGDEQAPAFADGDLVMGEPKGMKAALTRTNLFLFCIFLVGVGVVAFMAMRKGPQETEASQQEQEQVDQAINKFLARQEAIKKTSPTADSPSRPAPGGSSELKGPENPLSGLMADSQEIVQMFYNFTSKSQVPLEDLKTNPFRFGEGSADAASVTEEEAAAAAAAAKKAEEEARKKRQEEARKDLAQLNLQTILAGPSGSQAMINGNILRVGDEVQKFKIEKIAPRGVTLKRDGETYTLEMSF